MYDWSKLDKLAQEAEQEKQLEEADKLRLEKELEAKRKLCDRVSDNLSIDLEKLNRLELSVLYELVLSFLDDEYNDSLFTEERKLAWKALKDPAFVNYVQLKQSSQNLIQQNELLKKLGVHLSKISSDASSIKATNFVSGMFAARQIGEEIAEGPSGGD